MEPENTIPLDQDDALVHLYEAVQTLAQQVAEVRAEHEILREQVDKLHQHVLGSET
jgi:hypothetical protein